MNTARSWAEINIDALAYNMKNIRQITSKSAMIMAVIKSDAYGHGAVETARVLAENGADRFAVATVSEAVQLRQGGISEPVMILGATIDEEAESIVSYDIIPTVFSYEYARALSDQAVKQGKTVKVHIKIDTGMSRIGYVAGVDDNAVADEIIEISKLDNVEVEGIFSHFATSDEADRSYMDEQFERFIAMTELLERRGLKIPIRHIANSAAIMMYPHTHLDMVRAGIVLYGCYPSDEVDKSRLSLRPVMSFKSRISLIKTTGGKRGVSYGKTFISDGSIKIATVPVGYADGYSRMLSGKAEMIVHDKKVPVIGRICMDQCMIDVTNVHNINTGDEVILFGDGEITADTIARQLGTINYEVICMVSKRIPRIYVKRGRIVKEHDYVTGE